MSTTKGSVENNNPNRRAAYWRSTLYEPTEEELASFEAVQEAVCQESTLRHQDPDKRLFLFQIDASIEREFGVMVYHLLDESAWTRGTTLSSVQIQQVMYLSRCLESAKAAVWTFRVGGRLPRLGS